MHSSCPISDPDTTILIFWGVISNPWVILTLPPPDLSYASLSQNCVIMPFEMSIRFFVFSISAGTTLVCIAISWLNYGHSLPCLLTPIHPACLCQTDFLKTLLKHVTFLLKNLHWILIRSEFLCSLPPTSEVKESLHLSRAHPSTGAFHTLLSQPPPRSSNVRQPVSLILLLSASLLAQLVNIFRA